MKMGDQVSSSSGIHCQYRSIIFLICKVEIPNLKMRPGYIYKCHHLVETFTIFAPTFNRKQFQFFCVCALSLYNSAFPIIVIYQEYISHYQPLIPEAIMTHAYALLCGHFRK